MTSPTQAKAWGANKLTLACNSINKTGSIDARCFFSFNLNEQLIVMVQKMHNVKESFPLFTAASGKG